MGDLLILFFLRGETPPGELVVETSLEDGNLGRDQGDDESEEKLDNGPHSDDEEDEHDERK